MTFPQTQIRPGRGRPRRLLVHDLRTAVRRQTIVGALNVYSTAHRHAFSHDDLQILCLLANQAAVAIEKAQLYAATDQSEVRYRSLFEDNLDGIILTDARNRSDHQKPTPPSSGWWAIRWTSCASGGNSSCERPNIKQWPRGTGRRASRGNQPRPDDALHVQGRAHSRRRILIARHRSGCSSGGDHVGSRRHRDATTGGATSPGTENGRGRHPGQWHRPRFQQYSGRPCWDMPPS